MRRPIFVFAALFAATSAYGLSPTEDTPNAHVVINEAFAAMAAKAPAVALTTTPGTLGYAPAAIPASEAFANTPFGQASTLSKTPSGIPAATLTKATAETPAATPNAKPADTPPRILISVDKSSQRMVVTVDGVERWNWAVSTGMRGYSTPAGNWKAFRMVRDHKSREWDNAPMPYSIFFTKRGHAIHGSFATHRLGSPASHGCVRLDTNNARQLFALVQQVGMQNTTVVITGAERAPAVYAKSDAPTKRGKTSRKASKQAKSPSAGTAPHRVARHGVVPNHRPAPQQVYSAYRPAPSYQPPQGYGRPLFFGPPSF